MPKLSEHGVIQFIVLFILLIGVVAGVYLVQRPQIFAPKANDVVLIPETSLSLKSERTSYNVGDEIPIELLARTDVDAANLFAAKLKFDKDLISIDRINTDNSFVTKWAEQHTDNNQGVISLVGGVPNPGLKTTITEGVVPMALLYFKAKGPGSITISIANGSAIYSNSLNINIITLKRDISIEIHPLPGPSPLASPSPLISPSPTLSPYPSASSSPTPTPGSIPTPFSTPTPEVCIQVITYAKDPQTSECKQFSTPCDMPDGWIKVDSCILKGDGNRDGKIDLADLSILLSDFNKKSGFRIEIDINDDGVINSFDFSLMRKLLIENNVIKE